ncbi:MAG TPA: hypothetical protein VLD65_02750 [Anaerolineales bacterium]|nr:hypothetical protein [Anaerolineales bacterium]
MLVARTKAAALNGNGFKRESQHSQNAASLEGSNQAARLQATNPAHFTLASGQDQIVMIFAPWDRISQDSAQLMQTFEEKYRGLVRFSYLDVSDPKNRLVLQKLNYWFYPQFVYLDGQGYILTQWTTPSASDMTMAIEYSRLHVPPW